MSTVRVTDDDGTYRVYTKGAPENFVSICSDIHNEDRYLQMVSHFACGGDTKYGDLHDESSGEPEPHKVIAFAYKDISKEDYEALLEEHENDPEQEGFREAIESELTYIGTVALRDPIRDKIEDQINSITNGLKSN